MLNKYTFIINPIAGKGRGEKIAPELRTYLDTIGCNFEIIFTKKKNDAKLIVENLSTSVNNHVVAVGGDGTVNEIVNGLKKDTNIIVSVLPIGSGNDFARSVNLLGDWKSILDFILASNTFHTIDLGLIIYSDTNNKELKTRYFACNCGIGFDAQVAFLANRNSILRGLPLYLLSVFRTMKIYKSAEYKGKFDNYKLNGKKLLLAIGNGITSGGGFRLNPNAKNNDGLLDYCIAQDMSKIDILKVLPKAIGGTHLSSKLIDYGTFVKAEFSISAPVYVHIDGEVISDSADHINIQIVQNALKTIVRV
jgi:YegS/Rv2252/BmrU family lipid kinase